MLVSSVFYQGENEGPYSDHKLKCGSCAVLGSQLCPTVLQPREL